MCNYVNIEGKIIPVCYGSLNYIIYVFDTLVLGLGTTVLPFTANLMWLCVMHLRVDDTTKQYSHA